MASRVQKEWAAIRREAKRETPDLYHLWRRMHFYRDNKYEHLLWARWRWAAVRLFERGEISELTCLYVWNESACRTADWKALRLKHVERLRWWHESLPGYMPRMSFRRFYSHMNPALY